MRTLIDVLSDITKVEDHYLLADLVFCERFSCDNSEHVARLKELVKDDKIVEYALRVLTFVVGPPPLTIVANRAFNMILKHIGNDEQDVFDDGETFLQHRQEFVSIVTHGTGEKYIKDIARELSEDADKDIDDECTEQLLLDVVKFVNDGLVNIERSYSWKPEYVGKQQCQRFNMSTYQQCEEDASDSRGICDECERFVLNLPSVELVELYNAGKTTCQHPLYPDHDVSCNDPVVTPHCKHYYPWHW